MKLNFDYFGVAKNNNCIYIYSLSQIDHWCCFADDAEEPSEGTAEVTENPRMDLGVIVWPRICQITAL